MHLKRTEASKTWALPRKGTKYLVRPLNSLRQSIPLLIILRDMLKIAKNRKEVKGILNLGRIKINGKQVREEKLPLMLFDNFSLGSKHFKLILKNKKFALVEINEKQADEKIARVIGKKVLKENKMQINLSDGRNYISSEKVKVGDSVVVNLKDNKISKILPFKKDCKIIFIAGKHLGEEGIVEGIDEKRKLISIKVKDEKINSRIGNLMVVD